MVSEEEMSTGSKRWVIADGYIPPHSTGPAPQMISHDSICMLNSGNSAAQVCVYVYFTDREPAGPFTIEIPPRRAFHQRINDLQDPEVIPAGVDYSLVITSDQKIVVQHTRLDSRQAENALMTTMGYPAG